MTFHGDGEPNVFEAEQAKGVDVFMHEGFLRIPDLFYSDEPAPAHRSKRLQRALDAE